MIPLNLLVHFFIECFNSPAIKCVILNNTCIYLFVIFNTLPCQSNWLPQGKCSLLLWEPLWYSGWRVRVRKRKSEFKLGMTETRNSQPEKSLHLLPHPPPPTLWDTSHSIMAKCVLQGVGQQWEGTGIYVHPTPLGRLLQQSGILWARWQVQSICIGEEIGNRFSPPC